MNGYLEQEWESLIAEVIPKNAPPLQVREMKRAFYMGAVAAISLTTNAADKLSEDDGVVFMRSLRQEMRDFMQQIEKGEA